MTQYGVLPTGFRAKTYDIIFGEMRDSLIAGFGTQINTTPESPEGIFLDTVARQAASLWSAADQAYHAFDPNASGGVTLQNLSAIHNIRRVTAQQARATVRFSGDNNTFIPAGTEVNTGTNLPDVVYSFTTDADAIVTNGSVDVDCTRAVAGEINLPSNVLTVLSNPVPGIDSVTNISGAVSGRDRETDPELRSRRNNSVAISATNTIDSIVANILQIPTVTSAVGYENDTGTTSTVGGGISLPPYSIAFVVQGNETAAEQDLIAQAIFAKRAPGIPTVGTTQRTVVDSQGVGHPINFYYPTDVPIQITITTKGDLLQFPSNGNELIQDAILAYLEDPTTGFDVGEDVRFARLLTPINSVPNHSLQSLTINRVGASNPTAFTDVVLDGAELAEFSSANITITVNLVQET